MEYPVHCHNTKLIHQVTKAEQSEEKDEVVSNNNISLIIYLGYHIRWLELELGYVVNLKVSGYP